MVTKYQNVDKEIDNAVAWYRHCIDEAVEQLKEKSQSPIELMLAVSFMALGYRPKLDAIYGISLVTNDNRTIETQVPIGSYKADFVVSWFCSGQKISVVVECDGHDYHERTKRQAAHDKKRDRYMLAQGWHVMRFTGSEIYRDAASCVMEVDEQLRALALKASEGSGDE